MGRDAFALAMDLAGEGGKAGIKLTAVSCCKVGPALCSATACTRKATPGSCPTSSRIPQQIFGWCWVYSEKLKIGWGGVGGGCIFQCEHFFCGLPPKNLTTLKHSGICLDFAHFREGKRKGFLTKKILFDLEAFHYVF